jgi:hypothetical protein
MKDVAIHKLETSKGEKIVMENFYTLRSLENILSWGNQPIPNP